MIIEGIIPLKKHILTVDTVDLRDALLDIEGTCGTGFSLATDELTPDGLALLRKGISSLAGQQLTYWTARGLVVATAIGRDVLSCHPNLVFGSDDFGQPRVLGYDLRECLGKVASFNPIDGYLNIKTDEGQEELYADPDLIEAISQRILSSIHPMYKGWNCSPPPPPAIEVGDPIFLYRNDKGRVVLAITKDGDVIFDQTLAGFTPNPPEPQPPGRKPAATPDDRPTP